MTGYDALRQNAAVLDLTARGRIRATGEDRKRLLHAMTTNHVQDLQPGGSLYAFFLNPQGRILADAYIYCGEDFLLLDVEPEVREKIYQHLDRFIIADDVTLEDVSSGTFEYGIEGPNAAAHANTLPDSAIVFGATVTGQPGFRVITSEPWSPSIPHATADEARIVRLENGKPRYGEDIKESNLVQETQQMHALHFSKGCYIGQEIVERVRSRGHVNRLLTALRVAGPAAAGDKVMAGEKEAGEITSAADSPALGGACALAYVRAEYLNGTAALTVNGAPVEVRPLTAGESARPGA